MTEERRQRQRSISPVPRTEGDKGSGPDWGRLIALVLVSAIGSGSLGAYGVNQLSEYRIEQLEDDFRSHELVPHRATTQGIDANKLRVENNARQIEEMRREMREQFQKVSKQIEELDSRRRR